MRKINKAGRIRLPDFTLYKKGNISKQYGTVTKTEICTTGTGQKSGEKPGTYGQLIYDEQGKIIYSGEKTASSISGAGKTGQPHVKE